MMIPAGFMWIACACLQVVDGFVIPSQVKLAAGGSPVSLQAKVQTYTGPVFDPDEELDVNVFLVLFSTLIMVYPIICLVYFVLRYVFTQFWLHRSRVSLFRRYEELEGGNGTSTEMTRNQRLIEAMHLRWPSALDDENEVAGQLSKLSPEDQFYYKQGEDYIRRNPPFLVDQSRDSLQFDGTPREDSDNDNFGDPIMNEQTRQYIEEEGAAAWSFQPDPNLPNDSVIIENKTEVTFLNYNYDVSISTNLPVPCINRVYYCEFKIFELGASEDEANSRSNVTEMKDNEKLSFGLSTSPYPYFRLPGRHHHSIAYDSDGGRRFNTSFDLDPELASLFPRCTKGDVIGIGYRTRSGAVFFTRNGKKLNEKPVGGHIKGWKFKYLYPILGANFPCTIHANFGTYGFVFIEANVKKWGYGKSHGQKLPPPSYDEYNRDTLLKTFPKDGEDNEEDDYTLDEYDRNICIDVNGNLLPPPPGFEYSTSPNLIPFREEINLNSLPFEPPSYSDDEIQDQSFNVKENLQDFMQRRAKDGTMSSSSNESIVGLAADAGSEIIDFNLHDDYSDEEEGDYNYEIDELQACVIQDTESF